MSTHSRRAILLAGIATAPALAAPALAIGSAPPDPIFALIEKHRAAFAAVPVAMNATDAASERYGWGAPEMEPFERAQSAATHKMTEAELALAQTAPTTLQGILAIMRYRRELDTVTLDGLDGYDLFTGKGDAADPRHEITSWLAVIEQSIAAIAGEAVS
jgi:hypothetical protein